VICKLAYDAMLRRGEIVKLSIGDVDLDARTLIVRLAKGRWSRTVPYSPSTANTIQRYLIRHREKRPGTNLVCASNGRQLYDNYLGHIFYKASQRLGRRVTPHMLRHSGATQFVRNGGSLEILRRILGHRSIRTTEVYMHLSGADVISWADRCSPLA
jgi:integrase/recombinase XerD